MVSKQKGLALIWILLIILLIVLIGAATFFGYRWYKAKQDEKNKAAEESSQNAAETTDPYAGWKTYTNKNIGYTLKYPADWSVTETDKISEITEQQVKYITLKSPKKSSLHFGISKAGETSFNITDRTGIGAGDDIPIPEKATTLLEDKITPEGHVWQGKLDEYFYKIDENKCGCNTTIWFSLASEIDWATQGESYAELDTVNLILASVAWTKTSSTSNAGSSENIAKAEEAATKYLDARMTRDLNNALPYMTESFAATMNQETFAGVSSPSMGKYTNVNGKYVPESSNYRVTATIHWYLQGEESGTSTWAFDVVNQNSNFLVNKVEGGYE